MLTALDVLIGLATVMLAFSLAVTALTQVITAWLNWRGTHLREGLVALLRQLDPVIEVTTAREIAQTVLTHPLVCLPRQKLGNVIGREELIKVLLGLAAGTEPQSLSAVARDRLQAILRQAGIADPAGTLRDIRSLALQLEAQEPKLASHIRQTTAIAEEAASEFVAKVNSWFDQTMDRVAERFATSAHKVTYAFAGLVVLLFQLDAIHLINRLSVDDELRRMLVAQAAGIVERTEAARPDALAQSGTPLTPSLKASVDSLQALAVSGVLQRPTWPDLRKGEAWQELGQRLPGMVVAWLLISLGAPFWYRVLRDLIRLRPVLAQKEEAQRKERQTTQAPERATAGDGQVEAVG